MTAREPAHALESLERQPIPIETLVAPAGEPDAGELLHRARRARPETERLLLAEPAQLATVLRAIVKWRLRDSEGKR